MSMPTLSQLWRLYFRRFVIDHWYRFAKQRLHWTLLNLSTPEQYQRWSDLLPLGNAKHNNQVGSYLSWIAPDGQSIKKGAT